MGNYCAGRKALWVITVQEETKKELLQAVETLSSSVYWPAKSLSNQ